MSSDLGSMYDNTSTCEWNSSTLFNFTRSRDTEKHQSIAIHTYGSPTAKEYLCTYYKSKYAIIMSIKRISQFHEHFSSASTEKHADLHTIANIPGGYVLNHRYTYKCIHSMRQKSSSVLSVLWDGRSVKRDVNGYWTELYKSAVPFRSVSSPVLFNSIVFLPPFCSLP